MNPQSMQHPPRWADAWLRTLLPRRDRDTVSGDLLEEYRANIRPRRSRPSADLWYLRQVSVFAWRIALWAVVLTVILAGRTAWDWFDPVPDFSRRASLTTMMFASVVLVIGASSALRTQSALSGVMATVSTLVLNAILCTLVLAVTYARWAGPETLPAIARSGGLLEVFVLPWTLIVPGTAVGAFAAWLSGRRQAAGSRRQPQIKRRLDAD
jgi:hypothetical protein